MRFVAIVVFALLAATAGQASAVLTPAVTPPSSSFVRPERVYVLPVVWIPSENAGTYSTPQVTKARTNLAIHLRTAQRKYSEMLRNPVSGDYRGTFRLATWDAGTNMARVYGELFNTLEPLVVQSSNTYGSMTDSKILGEVLSASGCKVMSCPFVFVILVHHASDDDGDDDIYAVPFNYGFNGGGGFVRIPLDVATYASTMLVNSPSSMLLSSIIHELGHAFGLSHLDAVFPADDVLTHTIPPTCSTIDTCPLADYDAWCDQMEWSREKLEFHCSPSIMSYSKRNRTRGCLAHDGAGTCTMPTAAQIATIPGILISENLNNLAKNSLVFPELAADFDLLVDDDDGDGDVRWHPGYNFPDNNTIPGHPLLVATSADGDTGSQARLSFGQHWRPIAPLGEAFFSWRAWRSKWVGNDGWIQIDFTFPQNVQLGRVRVYTGSDGGSDKAKAVEVRYGIAGAMFTTYCGQAPFDGGAADGEVLLPTCTASRLQRVRLKAGTSGRVVVRMIRFFDMAGNEIQGPGEPVASSLFTHAGAYATQPKNVVGGQQRIASYATGFDATRMWHSAEIPAGTWIAFDVRLPEKVALTSVVVYTGHSGYYHRSDWMQVYTRGENMSYVLRGDSGYASGSAVTVNMPATPARHVRLWMRPNTTPGTKHVVIRGIRFFTAQGEVFVPRSGYSGIAPVL